MTPLAALLRREPCFAPLSNPDLESLASAFMVDDFRADHLFIREGERSSGVFLVVSGDIVVTAKRGGRTRELNRMGPGQLFGLLSLVDDAPRSASCRAAGPCQVGLLATGAAHLLFNQHAPIACAFQRVIANQLARDFRSLDQRIRRLLVATAP